MRGSAHLLRRPARTASPLLTPLTAFTTTTTTTTHTTTALLCAYQRVVCGGSNTLALTDDIHHQVRAVGRKAWRGGEYLPKEKLLIEEVDPTSMFDPVTGWTQGSKRVGVVAVKLGMTSEYNEYYEYLPLTVLQIIDCQVVQIRTDNQKPGEVSIQVGAENAIARRVPKPQRGHFYHAGVLPKKKLAEFKVSDNAIVPVGTELRAEHFVPGQFLDVTGVTIGKGTQGVMKRWGFGGGRASHGASASHREPGSTGQHANPSRVFPGKKLPGRMGNEQQTIHNLRLWKIDTRLNLLYVHGSIPGSKGKHVIIKDAPFKYWTAPPPYPTFKKAYGEVLPEIITANSPVPTWWKEMEGRKVLYAEDPGKNRDDDTRAIDMVRQFRDEFPSVDKWRKGLLPPGPHPSRHPSCATAGVTIPIPWVDDIVAQLKHKEQQKKFVFDKRDVFNV